MKFVWKLKFAESYLFSVISGVGSFLLDFIILFLVVGDQGSSSTDIAEEVWRGSVRVRGRVDGRHVGGGPGSWGTDLLILIGAEVIVVGVVGGGVGVMAVGDI